MSYLTLTEAKKHCRIEVSDDDDWLAFLIDAAEAHVQQWLNRPLSSLASSGNSPPDLDTQLPPDVRLGILMHVQDAYENRSTQEAGVIFGHNNTAENLLYPYRTGLGV
jgi:hypothetical protein